MRLSNSQAVSLIQRVLKTLGLRLIMNDGFSFDSANRVFRVLPGFIRVLLGFMGESLVIAVKFQQIVTTKLAHVHKQSEFT